MRRLRNRGPSTSELIRQTRVRRLLSKYGAYSRQITSRSAASELESSSCLTASRSSKLMSSSSSSSALQIAANNSALSRRATALRAGDDLKLLAISKPSQLIPVSYGSAPMDKGLALAAAQHVSRVLADGAATGVDSQRVKEDFLHLLERDWGFAGQENLNLGRIRITIKRRDNELDNFIRRAELERAALEKSRLENRLQENVRRVQAVSSSSSQEMSSSTTTKVVKTRVVKTTKRTVQTVRAA